MQFTPPTNKFKNHLFNTNPKHVKLKRELKLELTSLEMRSLYSRNFSIIWYKNQNSITRNTSLKQRQLNPYNLTTFYFDTSCSSKAATYFGRSCFINNHKNRVAKKSMKFAKLPFRGANLKYLQYLLNYTWFTQLLAKTNWQVVAFYLQTTGQGVQVWVKNKKPVVAFWDQLLLTKI